MNPKRDQPPIVLVVEDDPHVRDFAEFIIADDLGLRTLAAATAKEAILLLEEAEIIDVMFTDITLPDGPAAMDGLELARKAVELHPRLRVIYPTGGGRTDSITARFVDDGTFLSKPYSAKQLMRALGDHAILAPGILAKMYIVTTM
jgi:CheY-like chemotaxis protein